MAFPPITHASAAYPNPMHSARLSTRWSRHSRLSNEDWCEGGMGTPLVHELPLPPTTVDTPLGISNSSPPPSCRSFRASIRNSWRSSFRGSGSPHRWSILSSSSPSPFPANLPNNMVEAETHAPPMLRKRKRWSNAIGSTTTHFVGNVRSSWGDFNTPSSTFSQTEVSPEEITVKRHRGSKRKRFLYGIAMSFGGLGAAGRVVG
ncbi:MAG: hypothetical protein Q9209_007139 [Squamulea sp. 1 TL-2023]